MPNSRKITKKDWQRVLHDMQFYNRKEGYVDMCDNKLTFFDSDPCINGIHACHVTLEEVINYYNEL